MIDQRFLTQRLGGRRATFERRKVLDGRRIRPALLTLALILMALKVATTIGAGFPPEQGKLDAEPPGWPVERLEPAAGPEGETSSMSPGSRERDPLIHPPTPTEQRLLVDLSRRRALLDDKEGELEMRARLLERAAAEIAQQIETLAQLKQTIEGLFDQHDASEEAEITRLVKIYEAMKPKAAAEIFDRLEIGVLLDLTTRMSETKASAIMARMIPARAEALTRELARRRRLGDLVAERLKQGDERQALVAR